MDPVTAFWEALVGRAIAALMRAEAPAVLLFAIGDHLAAGIEGEVIVNRLTASQGFHLIKFKEPGQLNYMVAKVPMLSLDELLACRKGRWSEKYARKT